MSHHSPDSLDDRTAWSADDTDDSMEFEEFASVEPSDAANGASEPAELERPAWMRSRSSTDTAVDNEASEIDVEFSAAEAPPELDDSATDADEEVEDVAVEPVSRRLARKKRKSRRSPLVSANVPEIEVDAEEETPPNWTALLLLALKDGTAGSFGVSVAVHTVIAIALAIVVKESLNENQSISMILTEADAMPIDFDDIEDISVDMAGGSETQVPQFQNVPLAVDSALTSNASELMSLAGSGEGDGGDMGFGFKFKMPEGGKAVSAGSFTAWTVPEDPRPGQDYIIVIRVKVPKATTSYRVSDLSGQIVGTDGYTLQVPVDNNPSRRDRTKTERAGRLVPVKSRDRLRVVKGHVQLMVDVPGAASLTRDTIQVRSRMLKEEQKLEIVF